MANDKALAIQETIQSRAVKSEVLLKRMGITPEEFERVALNALMIVPALADCDPRTIDKAIVTAINVGLLPDSREAVIVPFGKVATLIPMIEGKIKLARNATKGLSLRFRVVYDGDEWEYSEGLFPKLHHVPSPTADHNNENIIAAYAIARIPGSMEPEYEVMLRGEIDRFRSFSRGKGGPWEDHYGEMAKKAVGGRLLKRLPRAPMDPGDPPPELRHLELDATFEDVPPTAPALPAAPAPSRRRQPAAQTQAPPPEEPPAAPAPADDEGDGESPF